MAKKKDASAVAPFVSPGGAPASVVPPAPAAAPPSFLPAGSGAPPPGFSPFGGGPSAAVPQVITGEINANDYAMQLYLKGSDVPMEHSTFKVKVVAFVKIPNTRSPLVAQIEPMFGKQYLPLNKTNIKQIAGITQQTDLRCVIGRFLHLTVYPVNNPQSGQMSRGLYVSGAE